MNFVTGPQRWTMLGAVVAALLLNTAGDCAPVSRPISSVLREPLPAEELRLTQDSEAFVIEGPTFTYSVSRRSGAVRISSVFIAGQKIAHGSNSPADIQLDG